MTGRVIGIIPARHASTRFPGKPLTPIVGRPMIAHVHERARRALDEVVVATESQIIVDACAALGIPTVMTSDDCTTGTDRVLEAARTLEADVFVNIQGDEPLVRPEDIAAVVDARRAHPGSVINAMSPIDDEEDWRSTDVPKVVAAPDGRLLYMSRGAIPTTKAGDFRWAYRQVCIYAFDLDQLEAFGRRPERTPIEAVEDIEILRFLELGIPVRMVEVEGGTIAVDRPEDVARVEARILQA